ncbi:transmembrane protein 65 isoform X1 [Hydra vulgaris]|uniref:transmembrane protein 65 isoform X1 n=1 Tax=Hydra vulgaris TaxID=6087 RepID=UPI001F5FCAF4|nr:transmembrane protein 65 isoform X1 [Hydra vulgaris]
MKSKLIFFASRGACILSKNQFYISQRFISYNALKSDIYNSKKITSSLAANNFVTNLCHDEREHLKKALLNIEQKNSLEKEATPEPSPSWKQLQLVAISNGIPFIGFGFIDNSIMILAGEYIDLKLGVIFGMSTMTAAAIGNMVSDVSGIILAGYIEAVALRFGIVAPTLTAIQNSMKQTKITIYAGRMVGVILGCILGMFPLLFKSHDQIKDS